MNKQIGTLQPVENDQNIPAQLDRARRALAEATEDWQRVAIRDEARVVVAATEILNRKDIQVHAANLVQDAERAIAKANPPQTPQESGKRGRDTQLGGVLIENTPEPSIKPQEIRKIRMAHDHLSDPEYEAAKAEAVETETPLTRSALQGKSKQKRRAEIRQKHVEKLSAEATQLPSGEQKFSVIYADPPWQYDFTRSENREIENHYPTMEIEKIKALNVSAFCHTDAVLYLWATAPKLRESLSVIKAWGFEYKTHMVWVKDKIGMGYWARSQHELLLIGTRGNFSPPSNAKRVSSIIEAPRRKHSEKPLQFAELLESLYPDMAKIELFCRSPREGWTVWGYEAAISK